MRASPWSRPRARCPKATAIAERWIRTLRAELTDRMLVLGHRHPHRMPTEYLRHYNHTRPHRSLGLQPPGTLPTPSTSPSTAEYAANQSSADSSTNTSEPPDHQCATEYEPVQRLRRNKRLLQVIAGIAVMMLLALRPALWLPRSLSLDPPLTLILVRTTAMVVLEGRGVAGSKVSR